MRHGGQSTFDMVQVNTLLGICYSFAVSDCCRAQRVVTRFRSLSELLRVRPKIVSVVASSVSTPRSRSEMSP